MASTHRDRVRKCPISVVFFSLVGLQVLWVIFSIQGIERPAEPSCGSGSSGPCEPRKPQLFDHNQKLNGTWRELSQPRVLYNGEDDRMRRNMNFPWWICYELCKQTVYYVPSGTFVEQLHVLAILLKLSRERGFAVKYVHAPDRGSPAWDQIFELPLMDIETCVRKGSKQTDVVQSNKCLISRREEISGMIAVSEKCILHLHHKLVFNLATSRDMDGRIYLDATCDVHIVKLFGCRHSRRFRAVGYSRRPD